MSLLRPRLSRRVGLPLLAAALLLIGTLVAAPSVSGAPPARVKQFTASLSGGAAPGSFTMTVTNCGGTPLVAPCTRSSTIDLGAVQIVVPSDFQPATFVSALTPSGTTWTGSYNTVTNTIDVIAPGGSNKLGPGQSLLITFTVTTTTTCEASEFTTSAWGSNSIAGSESFELLGSQPTVACVASGGTAIGPNGQTETITGDFEGTLIVTFGGVGPNCGGPEFGALGDQWEVYHLPTSVTIMPGPGFTTHPGDGPKVSASEFPLSTAPGGPGADSSWYLICYAVPQAGHTQFVTRGGGLAVAQTVGGVLSWVGILANCADAPTPCVSEQFLTTGQPNPTPPWTPSANRVHIANTMDPGDPWKR